MKLVLFGIIYFLTFTLFAQPGAFETELKNGKKYYVHWVQSGNTLYGLQQKYGVNFQEIIAENPGAEKGLKEGQKILIPVPLVQVQHEVQPKETLYSIAKAYGVTTDVIVQSNPGCENGIKVGQKLLIPGVDKNLERVQSDLVIVNENPSPEGANANVAIPQKYTISVTDSIIDYKVLDGETLYSISKRFMVPVQDLKAINELKSTKIQPGDVLRIPIKKEKIEEVKVRQVPEVKVKEELPQASRTSFFADKNEYTIGVLLPFNLDKSEGDARSVLATEFYMGVKLALDSLESMGLKAKVHVFDTRNDLDGIKAVIQKMSKVKLDAVVGPFLTAGGELVAEYCKNQKINMICPVAANASLILDNPYVFQTVASEITQIQNLAQFVIANQTNKKVILIKPSNEADQLLYASFREYYLKNSKEKAIEASLQDFSSYLKKGTKYILVAPSNDRVFANKVINSLIKIDTRINSDDLLLMGTKDWLNMDEIKSNYRNKYHFHFCSPNDLNYTYDKIKAMNKIYRSTYQTDLSKTAVQGFDVVYFFGAHYLLHIEEVNCLMNSFNLIQKGEGNGYENTNTFILKQENFQLINCQE